MNYYTRHIGDYITKTIGLTLVQHGAYNRLLDIYYSTEQPISLDIAAVCLEIPTRNTDEEKAVDQVLNSKFFEKRSDGYHQKRCDKEIALWKRNRKNGEKGGRPKKDKNPEETQTEPTPTNPEETLPFPVSRFPFPKESNTPLTPPASGGRKKKVSYEDDENFTYFWDQYRMPEGREKGSKKKAFVEWRNLNLTDQEYAFYMLDLYLAETNKNEGGRYRKQVYLYLKDRLWEQFDVPESIRQKITSDGGES